MRLGHHKELRSLSDEGPAPRGCRRGCPDFGACGRGVRRYEQGRQVRMHAPRQARVFAVRGVWRQGHCEGWHPRLRGRGAARDGLAEQRGRVSLDASRIVKLAGTCPCSALLHDGDDDGGRRAGVRVPCAARGHRDAIGVVDWPVEASEPPAVAVSRDDCRAIARLLPRERDSADGSAFGSGEDRRGVSAGRASESPLVEVR